MQIRLAEEKDINELAALDQVMIGSGHRKGEIKQAVQEKRCLIVFKDGERSGFLIYHVHFFDCCFVSLIMIKPSQQRQGLASALLTYMTNVSPTEKLFSSTNESNLTMQKVFTNNGFSKCGFVDNLDEGDPEWIYFKKRQGAD